MSRQGVWDCHGVEEKILASTSDIKEIYVGDFDMDMENNGWPPF